MRDSPNGIFGSWAQWTGVPPNGQSSLDAAAVAAEPAGAALPRRAAPVPVRHIKTPCTGSALGEALTASIIIIIEIFMRFSFVFCAAAGT